MDWDDYRFMESIARQGSVRGAAQALGVNASTVTRRLEGLEQRLGVLLFTRSQQGLKITDEGVEVVERLQQIGDQLRDIEVSLKGRDQRLEGRIRLAIPDVLAVNFLLNELAEFTDTYPGIDLELMPGYQNLDPARGEIDIVIRATETPPEAMVGRPLARVALAAYGSRRYVEHIGGVGDGSGASWVDWAAPGEVMTLYGQLRELHFPRAHVHLRCDQVLMQHAALRANMGLGILPCLLGDADDLLCRLPQMPVHEGPMMWLLTHPDLRNTRRIQVFMAFVRDLFSRRQLELRGEPQSATTENLPGAER